MVVSWGITFDSWYYQWSKLIYDISFHYAVVNLMEAYMYTALFLGLNILNAKPVLSTENGMHRKRGTLARL